MSLAAANGFAPRHAHAEGGGHGTVAQHAHHGHDHHPADAIGDHDHAVAASCDIDATPGERPGVPISNCCVASCAAAALIFATVDLPNLSPMAAFVSWTPAALAVAARTSDDPPPR